MKGYLKFNLASQDNKPNISYQSDWAGVERIHCRTHTDPLNFNAKGVGGIELKTDKGRLQSNQITRLQLLNDEGYLAVVCRGYDEAVATLKSYLEIP